ncbi:hypothetical protein YPPY63_3217, partial [Yersinia pestis PY-63]
MTTAPRRCKASAV